MWTLLPLKYRRHIFAGNGQSGSGGRSFGKDGEDVVVDVPCGTVVYDAETGEYLTEVTDDGQEIKLLKGGRGGWATGISRALPTARRDMLSRVNRQSKSRWCSN